jgi:hypothetical protein
MNKLEAAMAAGDDYASGRAREMADDTESTARDLDQPEVTGKTQKPETAKLPDPVPDTMVLARQRSEQYVGAISSQTLQEYGALRDDLDNVIRGISDSPQSVVEAIVTHTQKVTKALRVKSMFTDALAELRRDFPPGGGTVTGR